MVLREEDGLHRRQGPPSLGRSFDRNGKAAHAWNDKETADGRSMEWKNARAPTHGRRKNGGRDGAEGRTEKLLHPARERASTIDKGDAKHTRGCSAQLSGITKEGRRALRDRPPPCHPTFLRSEKMRCQIEGFAVKRSLLESRRDLHVRRTTKLPATGDGFLFSPWFGQPRPKCSHVTGGCSDSGITSFLKRQVGAQTECITAEGGKRTVPGLPRREPRWIDPSSSVFVPAPGAGSSYHGKFSILRRSVATPMKNNRGGNSGTKGQSFPLMIKMKQNTQLQYP